MPDKKPIDSEIVKALECCIDGLCDDCPFYDKCYKNENICEYALDLINRQKAENKSQSIMIKMLKGSIEDYKNGLDRAIKFLMGQVMKETKGKANPKLANDLLVRELENRN